jgi:hypothetical protein
MALCNVFAKLSGAGATAGRKAMAYDASSGRDPRGGWCLACRRPLDDGQPVTRISFQTDPEGKQGLSGLYHRICGKPFSELAKVINLNPWARF